MRKEQFEIGSIIHIYNRGNRKQKINIDEHDKWRFLQSLYYFNNSNDSVPNIFRELKITLGLKSYKKLIWPKEWSKRNKLVEILGFTLKDNHYHLILQEIREGGTATFMQKFGTSLTKYFNTKYKEVGRLFQGPYKAKVVNKEHYLDNLVVYVLIKNIFELYPGGLKKAMGEFDKAFKFACDYEYSSLKAHVYPDSEQAKIINKDILLENLGESAEIFSNLELESFKNTVRKNINQIDFNESDLSFSLGDGSVEARLPQMGGA